jgi:hypothetical protein
MLNTVTTERSSPEVMSRFRHNEHAPPSPCQPARAVFPEPTPSAADRAAAAAAASSVSRGSSHSPHSASQQLPEPSAYLGPAPPPRAAAAAGGASGQPVPLTPTGPASNGMSWGFPTQPGAARVAPQRAAATPTNGDASAAGLLSPAGSQRDGAAHGASVKRPPGSLGGASEGSQYSMQSEPPKSADYMSVISMLERVRLRV